MKNVAIINNGDNGSTGNIAKNLHRTLKERGYNSVFCYGRGKEGDGIDTYKIDSKIDLMYHAFMTRITGLQGFYSNKATSRLLSLFDRLSIDTIYVVCIHGYYINEKKLYKYVADHCIKLVHIMIDEYAFTGKCAYRDGCEKYKTGCGRCPHKSDYPTSFLFDGSKRVYCEKKASYSTLKNAVFVGPQFVVNQAQQSPLFIGIRTAILDEAIDMDLFYPKDATSLRDSLGINEDKKIIVCVAPYAGEKNDRKGGRYFIELARTFEHDGRFVFVHVGYRNKKKEQLPCNYLPVGFINNQSLLAEFFSLADLFVFPSLLDTMPNACLDALSCGTPLLCFDISGMPFIASEKVGTFVEPRNVDAMAEIVNRLEKKTPEVIKSCRDYALSRYNSREYNNSLIRIASN